MILSMLWIIINFSHSSGDVFDYCAKLAEPQNLPINYFSRFINV